MKDKFRSLSLDGLVPFARGGVGECYRLDGETILKLYFAETAAERVLQAKEGARAAFVAGVPTAISFEPVQAGGRYGVLYEYIRGKTVAELAAQDSSRAGEYGAVLADVARTLRDADTGNTVLPRAAEPLRAAAGLADFAPPDTLRRIAGFIDGLDREQRCVHGDFHPCNVIITDGGPLLIDMDGFSAGCPLIDAATLRFSLLESPSARQEGRNTFNGLTREESLGLWQGFARAYFGDGTDAAFRERFRRIVALKKLWYERFYARYTDAEYSASVRREVLEAFGRD